MIEGVKELVDNLNAIPKRQMKALEEGSKRLVGITKANIVTRTKNGGSNLSNTVVRISIKDGYMVSVTAPYAAYVEYGTKYMVGKHYFGDAIKTVYPNIIIDMEKEIKL